MVMWTSTGNGQNLYKNPFKLENAAYIQTKAKNQIRRQPLTSSKHGLTNQQWFQYKNICKSARVNVYPT